jgi:hypothetical protein
MFQIESNMPVKEAKQITYGHTKEINNNRQQAYAYQNAGNQFWQTERQPSQFRKIVSE